MKWDGTWREIDEKIMGMNKCEKWRRVREQESKNKKIRRWLYPKWEGNSPFQRNWLERSQNHCSSWTWVRENTKYCKTAKHTSG